jgi:hypothetical protein
VRHPAFGCYAVDTCIATVVVRQLFVSEPFYDTIAIVDLGIVPTATNPTARTSMSPIRATTRSFGKSPAIPRQPSIAPEPIHW